jgi:Fe-S cluster biogenesis protein NfuA
MHSGSVEVVSYEEEEYPTLNLIFHGMCGSCPSSFDQTLTTVSNFIEQEAEIENLIVNNVTEKPKEFNMKYVFDPEED